MLLVIILLGVLAAVGAAAVTLSSRDRINASATGVAERLTCDEERIRRWKAAKSAGRHPFTDAR